MSCGQVPSSLSHALAGVACVGTFHAERKYSDRIEESVIVLSACTELYLERNHTVDHLHLFQLRFRLNDEKITGPGIW